jgi:hypothetical protein
MTKFSLSVPKVKFPHIKRIFYWLAGAAVVLAVLTLAVVRQVQDNRLQAQHDALVASQQAQAKREEDVKLQALQTQVTTLQGDKTVLCSYVKALTATATTKRYVALPAKSNCP